MLSRVMSPECLSRRSRFRITLLFHCHKPTQVAAHKHTETNTHISYDYSLVCTLPSLCFVITVFHQPVLC